MPALTAQKLIDEIQRHIVRHPESSDWPVVINSANPDIWRNGDEFVLKVERVVLDMSSGARHFIVE